MTKLTDEQMREMLGKLDAHCIRCGKKMDVDELMEGEWASRSENPFDDIICKDCLTDDESIEAQVNDATVDVSMGFDGKLKATGPFVPLEGIWACELHPYGEPDETVEFGVNAGAEEAFLSQIFKMTSDVEGDIVGFVETYKQQDFETRAMFLALFFYEFKENGMLIVCERHGNETIQDMMRRVKVTRVS